MSGAANEVKLTTLKVTDNGFTNGDMYFSSDTGIGWVAADGTISNLTWCTLTNDVITNALVLRGGLYPDRTGTFSSQLIAVTSDEAYVKNDKGIWRVDGLAHPILLTNISTPHLEGVITLTNDVQRWGPWAGKILTGDEGAFDDEGNLRPLIYAIDTNGVVSSFSLGIAPEDFDIILTNQDYYACDVGGENASNGLIVKLSRTLFADYVGALLITDAAEVRPPDLPLTVPFRSKAFIVRWDGTNFVTRKIDYTLPDDVLGTHLEHATFAPINLPNLIP